MENEKKYIRYKGVTRLPSDHDAFDGELEDVVNLAVTGGELRPVLPPGLVGTIPGQFKFVHKNQGYEHFICLDGNVLRASDYANDAITSIGAVANLGSSTLRKVDAIGNTLVVLTNNDVLYVLWKDGGYITLGSQIPFPMISVGHEYVDLVEENVDFTSHAPVLDHFRDPLLEITDDQQRNFCDAFYAKVNATIGQLHSESKLVFPYIIRYAVRLNDHDRSLVMHSQPLVMTPSKFLPFYAVVNANGTLTFAFHVAKIKLVWDAQTFHNWGDLISSVDFFISNPIYNYNASIFDRVSVFYHSWFDDVNGVGTTIGAKVTGCLFDEADVVDKIANTGTFFKIHSMSLDELTTSGSVVLDPGNIQNVVHGELMEDDYLTHNKISADNSFAYNDKIHLTGVTEKLFGGYSYGLPDVVFAVGNKRVQANVKFSYGNPMLFYPDSRASKAFIHRQDGTVHYNRELLLTPHKYLNGAFYIDPTLNNVGWGGTTYHVSKLPSTTDHEEKDDTKLYVSKHQNPFVFPVNSRHNLPVGSVIAVSTNTEAISEGQYGQFPLYAFSDDGIWILEVNQEGKYSARQPVSRSVIINPNVLQMDKALVVVTGKGVAVLAGEDPLFISDIIMENNIRSSIISISPLLTSMAALDLLSTEQAAQLVASYETDVPFETFAAGATLAFDYITGGGRIFVINPLYGYMYVYGLESGTWSKILGSYKRVVSNYPDCYVQGADGKVYNLAHIPAATDTKTICMLVTRPIKFDDYNFLIRSLAHRGIFKSALNVIVYASRNGIDYTHIMHGREKLIRMTGSGYKFYKLLVVAELDSNEALSGIEVDFKLKYPNRMR